MSLCFFLSLCSLVRISFVSFGFLPAPCVVCSPLCLYILFCRLLCLTSCILYASLRAAHSQVQASVLLSRFGVLNAAAPIPAGTVVLRNPDHVTLLQTENRFRAPYIFRRSEPVYSETLRGAWEVWLR